MSKGCVWIVVTDFNAITGLPGIKCAAPESEVPISKLRHLRTNHRLILKGIKGNPGTKVKPVKTQAEMYALVMERRRNPLPELPAPIPKEGRARQSYTERE
jgi:hypothetical protein